MLPEAFRFWELTRMSLAAWGVAGSIGYVLYLRPRLYPPPPEHRKAKAFTPREAPPVVMYRSASSTASLSHGTRSHGQCASGWVEEWNAGKGVKPVQ